MGTTETRPLLNLQRALAIKGFMNTDELSWLADAASRHHRICEVGCWTGRSTRALVDNTPGLVWAVDHFAGGADGDLQDILAERGRWWALDEFNHNLRDAFAYRGGNLRLCCEESTKAAEQLRSVPRFDMIFLDGCHAYESVKADILAWTPRLVPGGLLCGHDFKPEKSGVVRAVTELIPGYRLMDNPTNERTIWWRP